MLEVKTAAEVQELISENFRNKELEDCCKAGECQNGEAEPSRGDGAHLNVEIEPSRGDGAHLNVEIEPPCGDGAHLNVEIEPSRGDGAHVAFSRLGLKHQSLIAAEDIICKEDLPGFDRSTVDGFAVRALDTFGCSESIPAILKLQGEILMGDEAAEPLKAGHCFKISTGGMLPPGADAVVMLEYTESYGAAKDEIGALKPVAAGSNIIFKGDDRKAGEPIIYAGRRLTAADIGALAAAGISRIKLQGFEAAVSLSELFGHEKALHCSPSAKEGFAKALPAASSSPGALVAGIISTGDELVSVEESPKPGQIRNANSLMLAALAAECSACSIDYGIIKDDEATLSAAIDEALLDCDIILISGGSSAGEKDKTAAILASKGELLLHGIAIKPGKPTILANIAGKAVFGLPGHPVAALLVSELFVKPLVKRLAGHLAEKKPVTARLTENISSNHGREQIVAVKLYSAVNYACNASTAADTQLQEGRPCIESQLKTGSALGEMLAEPIITKSGLITALAGADGYFVIPRDCEGLPKGSSIEIFGFGE